jgi:hypothetical protein
MAAAIKQETNGRFDLQIFPSSQLGSDTDTLSQIRSGGVEFFALSGLILSTLVPAASISTGNTALPLVCGCERLHSAVPNGLGSARGGKKFDQSLGTFDLSRAGKDSG